LLAVTWSPQAPTSSVVFAPEPEKYKMLILSNVALRLTAVVGMTKLPLERAVNYAIEPRSLDAVKNYEFVELPRGGRLCPYRTLSGAERQNAV
jgi:hypothetical protein